MTKPAHRRHDISDHVWCLLEPYLSGRKGSLGGIAEDNHTFSMLYFGSCAQGRRGETFRPTTVIGVIHPPFLRWRDKGVWERLMEILIDETDYEWLMIDASHGKVHPHAAGARGGN